jgi:phosphoenolpyruvate---glycerone phosphotransferase subunit DhaL
MEAITSQELGPLFRSLADVAEEQKAHFNKLDAVLGDGDMGITLACGFQAIRQASADWDGKDCGQILHECGMAMANAAAGTVGTLLASALMSAGKQVAGKMELRREDIAAILSTAYETIQKRGRAQLGDKTMLDALHPACVTVQKAVAGGQPLSQMLSVCGAAAAQGAESTRNMVANQGRARWFQERSSGQVDPGAQALATLIRAGVAMLAR